MPRYFPLDTAWWIFNGTNAALRLAGSNAKAPIFDPESHNHDFTVAGVIAPDSIGGGVLGGIFSKWKTTGDKRSWMVRQNEDDLEFQISQDGTSGAVSSIVAPAALAAGTKAFFCGRYDWVSDGASLLDLRVNDTTITQVTNAHGPVYSTTSADVMCGAYDDSSVVYLAGKGYWLAFWNRRLSDTEIQNLRSGASNPETLGADFLIDFHQAVAGTYVSELPQASNRGPVTLTVEGTCAARSSNDAFSFDGSDDYYALAGTDPLAPNFDPATHGNDFSIAGEIMPAGTVAAIKTIFGKFLAANRTWSFHQNSSGQYSFQVSQNASGSEATTLNVAALLVGNKQFFCGRYDYVADGTSQINLRVDDTVASATNAHGPAYSNTAIPVRIGSHDSAFWNGKVYWLAYWKRKLTDTEVACLRSKDRTQQDLSCDFYISFVGKDVSASTISSDIPSGGSAIPFTKYGAPSYVLGGLASSDLIKGVAEDPVPLFIAPGGVVPTTGLGHEAQTRPRALAILRGIAAAFYKKERS